MNENNREILEKRVLELEKMLTEKEKADESLRESEEKYRSLFENASDAIFIINPESRGFLDCNENAALYLGYSRDELLQMKLDNIYPPEAAPKNREIVRELLEKGSIVFEHTQRHKDGHEIQVEISSRIINYGQEKVILSFVRDITDRKKTHEVLAYEFAVNSALSELYEPLIALSSTIEDIAKIILEKALALTGSKHGFVASIDPVSGAMIGHSLTEMMNRQMNADDADKHILSPDGEDGIYKGLRGYALNTRKPFYSNSPPQYPLSSGIPAGHIPITRFLGVPVILGDELVGQIALANKDEDYGEVDLETIRRLASYYALAVQRVRTEKALQDSERRFRSTFEQAAVGIANVAPDGKFLRINQRFCDIVGYSRKEMLLSSFQDITHPEDLDTDLRFVKQMLANEIQSYFMEKRYIRKDSTMIWVNLTVSLLRDQAGRPQYFISVVEDITHRKQMEEELQKAQEELETRVRERTAELWQANQQLNREIHERTQAEEALRESEERFRAIADYTYDWENWVAPNGKLIWTNPAVERITGYTQEEYLNHSDRISLVVLEEDQQTVKDYMKDGLEQEQTATDHMFRIRHKDGNIRWVTESFQPIYGADGKYLGLRTSIRDITERKQAESELKESEAQYRRLLEGIPGVLYRFSSNRGGIFYSSRVQSILGYPPDYLYKNPQLWNLSIHPADKKKVNDAIRHFVEGKDFELEYRIKDAFDQWHWFSDRSIGRRIGENEIIIEGLAIDITDQKKAKKEQEQLMNQLREAQKMEAIGTLAGGIAHDFNNILAAIIGYTELAQDKIPPENPAASNVKEVLKACNRAKDLIKQILAFSRQGSQELKPLQIQFIIKEAIKLLEATLPRTIEIRQDIDPLCGAVMADPTQIHQVVMNLSTNAYHAMRLKGGILGISLNPIEVRAKDLVQGLELEPGPYVKLTVSDTGLGMNRNLLNRIFDPYFTTKEKGEGTGLGLAVVHGIVKTHKGQISVYSEPGKGTAFHIYLPCIESPGNAAEIITPGPLPRGHEHILFIDDEETLVFLSKEMLTNLGYKITATTDSLEALQIFQKEPNEIDIVVTDMTMPQMTGTQLARKMLKIRPDIPIILCTGFSEMVSEKKAKELGFREYIMKPILLSDLAKTIRRVLDAPPEPPLAGLSS